MITKHIKVSASEAKQIQEWLDGSCAIPYAKTDGVIKTFTSLERKT